MDLLVQFQCLFYSFGYGFVMSGVYHIINRLLMRIPIFMRYLIQVGIGFGFGILYFYGLVILNDGILRFYFFMMMFLGYLFYQKYYAYYLLYHLEIFVRILKRIIAPFIFFFRYINGIIQKRVKKVKLKWQKQKNPDTKNS
ncbi:spore cortex biosynthesis protein YabQ [Candidatus Stoquefichus massiliensis]|uniref:spore cortex biosynthesis protein YabQ n=1 Tax=Candidatus Stoquefichus massiliensis TaxID=1470350 RepID=UPI0004831EF9|nr:spore cortex biosynthesis protein YabQ [Candidatus Stoquefichus massiliensis]